MFENKLIARIAELFYIHDISQFEIAKRFNFSTAKVCRILKEAKNKKIIEFKIQSFDHERTGLEKKLEDKFGLREAIIYYNDDFLQNDENIVFYELGVLAAGFFKNILKEGLNVAVSWGKTLYSMAESVEIGRKYNIRFFATLGGVSLSNAEWQSNSISQILANKTGGSSYPIYLPLLLEKAEHKVLLSGNNSMGKVLKDLKNIDYYFSGIGVVSEKSRLYLNHGFSIDFINSLREKNIVGEIGLNFFDSDGNFIESGIEDRTINLSINDIKNIKNRVAVSFGKEKIESIKGFLKTGIADVFITDSITAQLLIESN